MRIGELKERIRRVPDFPKSGITFFDLTTLFRDPDAFRASLDRMVERYRGERLNAIAGIEARGFILASAMAYQLGVGLILLRKPGKLPWETVSESYSLEYGEAALEAHRDAVSPGDRVLVVDDLLATGGTAEASGRLLERLGAKVDGYAFLVELEFLGGRKKLRDKNVFCLLRFKDPGG